MSRSKSYKRQRSLALLPRPDSPFRLPSLDSTPAARPFNGPFGGITECEEGGYRGKTKALIRRVEVCFCAPDRHVNARKRTSVIEKTLCWPLKSLTNSNSSVLKAGLKGSNPSLSFDIPYQPVFISGHSVKQKTRTAAWGEKMTGHKRQTSDSAVCMKIQRETRRKKPEIQRKPPCEVSLEGLLDSWTGIIKGD